MLSASLNKTFPSFLPITIYYNLFKFNILYLLTFPGLQWVTKKEGNVLFTDALNTFVLFTIIWRHTVILYQTYSYMILKGPLRWRERRPATTTTWATLSTDRITHTTDCVTPVVEHWLERDIAQWVHQEGSFWQPIAPWTDFLPRSYISFLI